MVRASNVMPAVLAEVIRKAPLCHEKVQFAWRSAVGVAVDRATSIRLEADGFLHVTADPAWAREVRRSATLIVARLATILGPGVVKGIRT